MVGSKLEQQPTHDWDWIFRLLEKESDDVYLRYYNYHEPDWGEYYWGEYFEPEYNIGLDNGYSRR